MLNTPKSKIKQISAVLSHSADGVPILFITALCEDGTIWQLGRELKHGQFLDDGWEQYPTGGAA